MSHLLDDDDDDLQRRRSDRELTLSTGAILGIFFGLVLICALFFGFGYNMGRKSTPAIAGTVTETPYENAASANAAFTSAKPSAGSPAGAPVTPASGTENIGEVVGTPPHSSASATASAAAAAARPNPAEVSSSSPQAAPITRVERPMPATSGSLIAGNFVVQVAAVSHQEDADLLVSALQRKGYSVAARNEPGDKLVHIQVGPFNDHKDADSMRQRLTTDGYNAIIKQL